MRRILDFQVDLIEMVLGSHGLASRVPGSTVTPHKVLSEESALPLDTSSCRMVRNRGTLNIEIPDPEPARVPLFDLCHRLAYVPLRSPVMGVDEAGTQGGTLAPQPPPPGADERQFRIVGEHAD